MLVLCLLAASPSWIAAEAPPPAEITRVVSIAPTVSEIICAIGACDKLVGVTRFDDYPQQVKGIAKIGGFVDPSLEAILNLRPHLVVLTKNGPNQSFVRALDQHKLPWIAFADERLDDFAAIAEKLGALLRREREAAALVAAFMAGLRTLNEQPRLTKSALVVYDHAPLIVAGPDTFGAEILGRCGLVNAYTGGVRYPTLDFETVVRSKPDVIIDVDMDGDGKSSPGYWSPVRPALKSAFVFVPDPGLMRLGPRLPGAMLALRRQIDAALAAGRAQK
ncbi:MAG: ABC transporter substrate-binding protein [Deltaproteobacteria bacterium]|nr:ABC transporter substrate-binding protein [Deltaproteobacteria bacterium]